jgi:hypothetical protein
MAGGGLSSSVGQAYSSVLATFLGPFLQAVNYKIQAGMPNTIPDVNTLLRLIIASGLGAKAAPGFLKYHGIPGIGQADNLTGAWGGVLDLLRSYPGPEELIAGLKNDLIKPDVYRQILRLLGYHDTAYDTLWKVHAEYAPPIQLIEMLNRGIIQEKDFKEIMNLKGYWDEKTVKQYLRIRSFLPGPDDIIRFAVREVYNPEQRQTLNLDAEFDDNKAAFKWFQMIGMMNGTYTDPGTGAEFGYDIARDYWAAHWQLPSPGQVFEMYQRLRPGEVDNKLVVFLNDEEKGRYGAGFVDNPTVQSYLKAADYAPVWRERLEAIARPPLGRIDLRRAWRVQAITEFSVLVERFKDLGYSEENASTQAQVIVNEEQRTLTKLATRSTYASIREMYEIGILDENDVLSSFLSAGLNRKEAEKAKARVLLETRSKRAKLHLRLLKKRFMRYEIFEGAIDDILSGIIKNETRRKEIFADWQLERDAIPKELTAKMLTEYYENDLLSEDELLYRLKQLGYQDADAQLIKDNVDIKKGKKVGKAAEAQEASYLRALRRVPRTVLQNWVVEGKIGPSDAVRRLEDQGFLSEDAEMFVKEALEMKDELERRAREKAAGKNGAGVNPLATP